MDWGYFNARLRAWKGELFKAGDYESFLRAGDDGAFLDILRSTPYGPYISVAEEGAEGVQETIVSALRKNLSNVLAELWGMAPPGSRPLMRTTLMIWEVHNMKTIIRGVAKGAGMEDVMDTLIPAGDMDRGALRELSTSRDMQDLVRTLETWGSPYAKPVREGLAVYLRKGGLMEIETRLDVFAYEMCLSLSGKVFGDGRIIRDMLSLRIDIQNVMTLFKTIGAYPPEEIKGFFIRGGGLLEKEAFLRLSSLRSRDDLLMETARTVKDRDMKEIFATADPDEMILLEERLEDVLRKRLLRKAVVNPLSIALAAFFLYAKAREIKNLRIIGRGKLLGIPSEALRAFLFYP